ncbi:MAG: signal recognition particle-docking protein FtsY [Thermoprotei archaeon]
MLESLKKAFSGFAETLTTRELDEKELRQLVSELRDKLLQSDVPYDVVQQICDSLSKTLSEIKVKRFADVTVSARETLKRELTVALNAAGTPDFFRLVNEARLKNGVCVVLFFGINGSGKTTTVAKVAYLLKNRGLKTMLVPSDTFRAGAIEQLMIHAQRVGADFFEAKYGSDPASVAYAAISEARAKRYDVVLIDTAGRMQTDKDLMAQMQKITRVSKPDIKVFVGDGLVGNDAVNQLRMFDQTVGIDGVIVTKLDADSKGGIIFSVIADLKKPVYLLGTGESYGDLQSFSPETVLSKVI